MARFSIALCVLLACAAAGCGSDRAKRGEGTIRVVATTVPLADIVRNAGGRRVEVTTLAPRATPADEPDLLVRSGGSVDPWAAGVAAKRALTLLPRLDPIGGDPHWWLDPVRVERAVKEIRNELARADVHGAGYYEAASADYLARLRTLDREIRACLALVRGSRERLAVPADAFGYFTARYGVRFHPARRATVGRRLRWDELGRPGSEAGSYLGAMAENTAAIVDALSRGRERCRPRP